jgi:hypothetical protein
LVRRVAGEGLLKSLNTAKPLRSLGLPRFSTGAEIEVLAPKELRKSVTNQLAGAAAQYI